VRHWMTSLSQQLTDHERRSDVSLEDGERILRELQASFGSLYFVVLLVRQRTAERHLCTKVC